MERVELGISTKYFVFIFLLSWISFFIAAVMAFIAARKYVRVVDRDGLELRNGLRIPFKEMTSAGWRQVGMHKQFYCAFGATEVAIYPSAQTNVDAAVALIERAFAEGRAKAA